MEIQWEVRQWNLGTRKSVITGGESTVDVTMEEGKVHEEGNKVTIVTEQTPTEKNQRTKEAGEKLERLKRLQKELASVMFIEKKRGRVMKRRR